MWSAQTEGETDLEEHFCEKNEELIINNVNLNSVAEKTIDMSGIDMDITVTQENACLSATGYDHDSAGYSTVTNSKSKNKRNLENTSPEEAASSKISKTTDNDKIVYAVFVKGVNVSLLKQNPLSIKKALLRIDNSIRDEQIKYSKDSIRINCRDESQKKKFDQLSNLMGIDVSVSEHLSLNRASLDLENYEKVIIFGVNTEITDEEIKSETKAISVKRLFKKSETGTGRIETESVILTYVTDPPKTVQIGFQSYKTKTFIPLPTRCWRCQRFGHAESTCRGKVTCPRCAENHKFENCPLATNEKEATGSNADHNASLLCVNCGQQHSAAYRRCPEFIKSKEIAKIKTIFKLTYSQATKKMKEDQETIPKLQPEPYPPSLKSRQIQPIITAQTTHSIYDSSLLPTPNHLNPSLNIQLSSPCPPNFPAFTQSNYPPIPNSTTSTPTRHPFHLTRTYPHSPLHSFPQTTTRSANFLLPVPNHIENFLSNLILLLIDLLSSYLPSNLILSKLANLTTILSSRTATEPQNPQPSLSRQP